MDSNHEIALHQVQLAVAAIRSRHPLMGMILALMSVVMDLAVTMATCVVRHGRITLVMNPVWTEQATLEQLEGVLLHEAAHLLLGHHELDSSGLNRELFHIAQDLCANEHLDRPAPAGTATLADFPGFPPLESVMERYRRLELLLATVPPETDVDGNSTSKADPQAEEIPADGSGTSGSSTPDEDASADADQKEPSVDEFAGGAPDQVFAQNESANGADAATPSASSSANSSTSEAPAANPLMVALTLQAAVDAVPNSSPMSPAEQAMVKMGAMVTVGRGHLPGGSDESLAESSRTTALAPWKRLLRRWVGQALPVPHVSYARPSRRFPDLIGIVPGKQSLPGKPIIQAVIDTSGSMSAAILSEIVKELRFMARRRRVIVVECDATVQRIYRFAGSIDCCRGRGGTDFRPAFERAVLRKTKAEAIIYFTDGDGTAPDLPPKQPVLWTLTTKAPPPASWGAVTRLLLPSKNFSIPSTP